MRCGGSRLHRDPVAHLGSRLAATGTRLDPHSGPGGSSRGDPATGAPVNRDDLCYESTVSLARRIRSGEVSPLQAVNAYLERIERVDPQVQSYLHVAADQALAAARRAEQALATRSELGSLHGVPVGIKDLFDTAGMPTTCGSPRIFGRNVPKRSATAVERLEQAGAIVLGKLHMTEFAFITHHP